MKRSICVEAAFSLVELTLALGIAAFCLIAVFGLMPVGVQTNRNATSQTAATNIMAAVIADLRAAPSVNPKSSQFCITFGTPRTLYFDNAGQCSTDLAGSTSPCGSTWSPALTPRYQLNVTWSNSGWSGLQYANVQVTWPAAATVANAAGSTQMFAGFDRN
jgi:hypothetical protein